MARPPTALQMLIVGQNPSGIYRVLKEDGRLTKEAARNRRKIIAALRLAMDNPPTGWTFDMSTGRAALQPGGRCLYDELLDVLYPYLNDGGRRMAETVALNPVLRERKKWWQFWR